MGVANGKYDVDFTEEVNLSHFKLLRVVGRGAFGKVRIVERRDNKRLFALKYISKEECIKMEALRNIFRERSMLEELDHPLVCNLRFAFQDDEYMYMVMDLMYVCESVDQFKYHLFDFNSFLHLLIVNL